MRGGETVTEKYINKTEVGTTGHGHPRLTIVTIVTILTIVTNVTLFWNLDIQN